MAAPISRETLERFAKNSKLLSLLDLAGLERLARYGVLMPVAADVMVVKQGETGDKFYLVASGEVRVLVEEAGGKEVARLGVGTFFGEMAVVARQPRSATVQTTMPSQLICFSREPLVQILRDYPKVREFLSSVGLARTEENITSMLGGDDGGLGDLLEPDGDTQVQDMRGAATQITPAEPTQVTHMSPDVLDQDDTTVVSRLPNFADKTDEIDAMDAILDGLVTKKKGPGKPGGR